jgi:hypothetical protein
MMAAPRICIEPLNDLRPKRVLVYVFDQAEKIGIPIAQNCLISPLEEVAYSTVFPVEVHRICLIQALHDLGQRDVLCLDQQVDVVVHEDIGVDTAAGTIFVHSEGKKVFLEVRLVLEDALFLVAADDDVIESTGVFNAWLAGHGERVAEENKDVNFSSI